MDNGAHVSRAQAAEQCFALSIWRSLNILRGKTDFTTHPAGGIRDTEVTEKYSTKKGYYRIRNSGDSVPDTHRRFAWCGQCHYPAGMRVIGYGRLPISDQAESLYPAFLSALRASSEAGGENGLGGGCLLWSLYSGAAYAEFLHPGPQGARVETQDRRGAILPVDAPARL